MRRSLRLLLLILFAATTNAAEVKTILWKTDYAAPAVKLDQGRDDLLPLVRFGVSAFPESMVMQMTFLGGSFLGLPPEKSASLHTLLSKRYQEITVDETFSKLPSALPYCYSATKPTSGYASVYVPDTASADADAILFLHGYGGSFIFYQHYLAEIFPEHIIICPAYGISSSRISSRYLKECLEAVSLELGFQLNPPVLMGLSAGGFGGFREYATGVASYAGYICIAAFPPNDVLARMPRTADIRLVAGADEPFVKDGTLKSVGRRLKRRVPNYVSNLIPNQDHFFMLSAEAETKKLLKRWDAELREGK